MQRNIKGKHLLSYGAMGVCAILFVTCMIFFITGQLQANKSIQSAGEAVLKATNPQNNPQQEIDYTSALIYLQTAQQAYSENSMVRLTSVIYMLASTIILGYGAKLLRLGKEDKDNLINTLYEQTKKQLDSYADEHQKSIDGLCGQTKKQLDLYADEHQKSIDKLYAQTNEQLKSYIAKSQEAVAEAKNQIFENIDCVSVLLNSSGNALHICFLLQSYIRILPLCADDHQREEHINTLERLEMEMIHSLQVLLEYMQVLYESSLSVNKNLQDMIHRNMILIQNSFKIFSSIDKPRCLKDDAAINRLLSQCESLCEQYNKYQN